MKIKIIQYFLGNNQKYLNLCKISEQINNKYALLNDYYYKFDYILNQYNITHQNGYKYKLQYIYNNLNNCDYLMFLDADAAVSNPNYKIEDLVDGQHELFLSRGNGKLDFITDINNIYFHIQKLFKMNNTNIINNWKKENDIYAKNTGINLINIMEKLSLGNRYFNQGVIIIKNTNKMKLFFKLCMENINLFQSDTSLIGLDGKVISFFLNNSNFKNCDTYLFDYMQGNVLGTFENKYNEDKTFIMHNYGNGLDINKKIQLFKQLLLNKWWKIIE